MFGKVRFQYLFVALILISSSVVGVSSAQTSQLTFSSHPNMIRFEAQSASVGGMALQVFGLDGQQRFSSGIQNRTALDWRLQSNSGQRLAFGAYLYKIELVDQAGHFQSQQIGKLIISPSGVQIGSQPIATRTTQRDIAGRHSGSRQAVVKAQAVMGDIGPSGNSVLEGFSGNLITGSVQYGTISGGGLTGSINFVTDDGGTVSGGRNNQAGNGSGTTSDAPGAVVAGGFNNTSGGGFSAVGGGSNNSANGPNAVIAGGTGNGASGISSAVPGGALNFASGDFSLAAGRRAKVSHDGSFAWADSANADFVSIRENEFAVRASGGVRLDLGSASLRVSSLLNCSSIMSDENGSLMCGPGGQSNFNRFQRLIIEECEAPFEAIRAIRADGTVDCTNVLYLLPDSVSALSIQTQMTERDIEVDSLLQELQQVKELNQQLLDQMAELLARVEALEKQ